MPLKFLLHPLDGGKGSMQFDSVSEKRELFFLPSFLFLKKYAICLVKNFVIPEHTLTKEGNDVNI